MYINCIAECLVLEKSLRKGEKLTAAYYSSINSLNQWSPIFLAPGTGFMKDNFSTDWGWILNQVPYIYFALYFYYYYISSTSDH